MRSIFCIGGANIDHKLRCLDVLTQETSNPVSSVTTFGGVARNVAENLSHWTSGIHLQCVIGDDNEGKDLLAHMRKNNVDVDQSVTLSDHATSHYYAVIDTKGDLQIAFADMEIYDHIPIQAFLASWKNWSSNSIVFIDTNLPVTLIEHAIQSRNKQIMLCIDPVSVPKAKKLPTVLENVFLIKPNQAEASAITNVHISSITDCFKAGKHLLDRGVKNVVISLGKNGFVLVNQKQQQHVNAMPCSCIKDVNGAGDAFVAGILYGLQQNSEILDACQLGAVAAALTLQSHHTVTKDSMLSFNKTQDHYATVF